MKIDRVTHHSNPQYPLILHERSLGYSVRISVSFYPVLLPSFPRPSFCETENKKKKQKISKYGIFTIENAFAFPIQNKFYKNISTILIP